MTKKHHIWSNANKTIPEAIEIDYCNTHSKSFYIFSTKKILKEADPEFSFHEAAFSFISSDRFSKFRIRLE